MGFKNGVVIVKNGQCEYRVWISCMQNGIENKGVNVIRTNFYKMITLVVPSVEREIQQSIHAEQHWDVPLEHTRAAWDEKIPRTQARRRGDAFSRRKTRAGYTMCCQ